MVGKTWRMRLHGPDSHIRLWNYTGQLFDHNLTIRKEFGHLGEGKQSGRIDHLIDSGFGWLLDDSPKGKVTENFAL